jgi:hypothetical protein
MCVLPTQALNRRSNCTVKCKRTDALLPLLKCNLLHNFVLCTCGQIKALFWCSPNALSCRTASCHVGHTHLSQATLSSVSTWRGDPREYARFCKKVFPHLVSWAWFFLTTPRLYLSGNFFTVVVTGRHDTNIEGFFVLYVLTAWYYYCLCQRVLLGLLLSAPLQ